MKIRDIMVGGIGFLLCVFALLGTCSTSKAAVEKVEGISTYVENTEYVYRFHDDSKTSVDIIGVYQVSQNLTFPAKLDGYNVNGIYFENGEKYDSWDETMNDVETITISDGVREFGDDSEYSSFNFGNTKEITFPSSVIKIGANACCGGVKLETVNIKSNKITIGERAFANSNIKTVNFPDGEFKGKIGDYAFSNARLLSLTIPYMKNMTDKIGKYAFYQNPCLKKVQFSDKYKTVKIGEGWFSECPKAEIIIGKNVKYFYSKKNIKTKLIRFLSKSTTLKNFGKIKQKKHSGYKKVPEGSYYFCYKKVVVPKNAKALKVLKKSYYCVNETKDYNNSALKKVKITLK